jgi:hypothetical protein
MLFNCTYVYSYSNIHVCIRVYLNLYTYIHVYVFMNIVYIYIHIYVYIHTRIPVCMHMYVYTIEVFIQYIGIPHVVAVRTDHRLADKASHIFTQSFYNALLCGKSVQTAFDVAVRYG